MQGYYREYIEVTDAPDGPYVAEVRMCHDFPAIQPNGGNQVVVFDERVSMDADFAVQTDPTNTDTWSLLAC